MDYKAGYKRLENSLIDIIKEEQAKLGYRKETIRLYYPLSSLNHFFEVSYQEEEMKSLLSEFAEYAKCHLGAVQISNKNDRFCFFISEDGVEYVHHHTKENEFIQELVELIGKHGCSMEDVKTLFLKTSKSVHMEPVNHGEFDYLIYFKDNSKDQYYYCFKDEGCHMIYHRFLPEDYEDFHFL